MAFAAGVCGAALADLGDAERAAQLERRLPARPEDGQDPLSTAARLHLDGARATRAGELHRAHLDHRGAAQALATAGELRLALQEQALASAALAQGQMLQVAEGALRKLRAQAEREGLRGIQALTALELGRALSGLGQLEEAELRLYEALELAESLGADTIQVAALLHRSELRQAAGALEQAVLDVTLAEERAARWPALHLRSQARLALLRTLRGELGPGLTLARVALERLDALGPVAAGAELAVRGAAAEVLLRSGLRDLGRIQLARSRERIAAQLGAAEPAWKEALARRPEVVQLAALAAEWLG
jgi:hypothetical protein